MKRIGILDDKGVLIGERLRDNVTDGDVEIGDLPANGTYRLQDGQFLPVGHGYGKPTSPPVTPYRALYLMIKELENREEYNVPQECKDYATWFEKWGN